MCQSSYTDTHECMIIEAAKTKGLCSWMWDMAKCVLNGATETEK